MTFFMFILFFDIGCLGLIQYRILLRTGPLHKWLSILLLILILLSVLLLLLLLLLFCKH